MFILLFVGDRVEPASGRPVKFASQEGTIAAEFLKFVRRSTPFQGDF